MAEQDGGKSGLDREQALGWLERDEKMLAKITAIFMKNMPQQMARLREAMNGDDAALVEQIAHSIKGASGMVGASGMKQESAKIETAAGAKNLDLCRSCFRNLEIEYARVMSSLKERA